MSQVGSGRVNKFSIQILRARPGRVKRSYISHGSGRVESRVFSNLSSRVGSGHEVFKCHGSGRVMNREIRVTRGLGHHGTCALFPADPRGEPADLACGFVILQTYSCLPRGHARAPRVRHYKYLPFLPIFRTPSAYHSV